MHALIIADAVHELFDDEPKLHPDLQVLDVSAVPGIAVGWTTPDGGKTWAPPPPPPPPAPVERTATTYQLMSALTDAQREAYPAAKPWDQRLFSARDTPWPESNPKILRIADALKTTPAAWFDAALTPAAG